MTNSCKYLTLCGDRFNICAALIRHVAEDGEYYEADIHTREGIPNSNQYSVPVKEERILRL